MRRGRGVALACAATLGLSACGGLATSSPVRPGLEVGAVQANEVRVLPPGPTDGSSPVDVVTGFIRAGAATDDEYQVARSYLAPSPESTWRPDGSVMVFTDESSLTISQVRPGVVRATARTTGAIDASGRYAERPPGSVVEVEFGLRQVDGQWRIERVPDSFGTWLSESDTDRLYDPFRIYFESATARELVPDVRYFRLASGLATRLARALLGGVPAYLAGAVRTELPAGAHLAVDAVPIDSGTATVDLAATTPVTDPARRQALAAQVLATVTQAPGVDKVVLQVDGTTLQVPGRAGEPRLVECTRLPACERTCGQTDPAYGAVPGAGRPRAGGGSGTQRAVAIRIQPAGGAGGLGLPGAVADRAGDRSGQR
ncbi:hypothetical protein GCM10027517_02510 [Phycicoccus ginsengisoli]